VTPTEPTVVAMKKMHRRKRKWSVSAEQWRNYYC